MSPGPTLPWLARACAALFLFATDARAEATPPSPQRYELSAELVPERHEVRGIAHIKFTNTSSSMLRKLVFHLYLNAFRNDESVFMRESGGELRGQRARGRGSIEISQLWVDNRDALREARRELIRGDLTQLEVPLETPLAPGARLEIETEFVAKLPPVFARSGYAGDFFSVAQWFPKLAKLEADGEFASFPYHALGEFYADFASYELELRTPERFTIAANGTLVREERDRGLVVRKFVLERAVDAVWVASPSLETRRERVGNVEVAYFYPSGYELALEEHAATVRAGLLRFSASFGPYPYPTLSVVIPPRGAEGAAGMEYPGLFLTDGFWMPTPGSPGASGAFVTAHELAHQWFSALIANDEVRWPVLDEGFAEWAALDLLRAQFGENGALSSLLPVSRFELERIGTLLSKSVTAPGRAAYAFTASEYGASVYGRAAIVLESVRRVYGKQRFERAMRAYADGQRFAHPTPDDLAKAFDDVYGRGFSARVLLPLLIEGRSCNVRIVAARSERVAHGYRTRVRTRRSGDVALPTWLSAFDARGRELKRIRWPEEVDALYADFETKEPVAEVALDADRALLVDDGVRDQVRVLRREDRDVWLSRIIAAAQALLSWVGP